MILGPNGQPMNGTNAAPALVMPDGSSRPVLPARNAPPAVQTYHLYYTVCLLRNPEHGPEPFNFVAIFSAVDPHQASMKVMAGDEQQNLPGIGPHLEKIAAEQPEGQPFGVLVYALLMILDNDGVPHALNTCHMSGMFEEGTFVLNV